MLNVFSRNKKHKIHFLHIGKTGGSAVKSVLREYLETPKYSLDLHGHGTSLKDIPKGEYVIFFLRDPVSRFISGFYSRQRKGRPLCYYEWGPLEKEVFEKFVTPNQVAVSLANKQSNEYALAIMAMKNFLHFKPYKKWYGDFEYFESRMEDVLFVGFQESLDNDFSKLKRILGVPQSVSLPADDITAHRNPTNLDKSIEESGVLALHKWYSDDFEFMSRCKEIMSNRVTGGC